MVELNALRTEAKERTGQTIEVLKNEFVGLRTGRASINMLDPVRVDVYGSLMPISQLASVSTPEPQMISVSVWDNSTVGKIEKAIRESGLGLNPQVDGTLIRLRLPPLTEERRKELVKVAKEYAENAQVACRNIRQDIMQKIKKAEAEKLISEDDQKHFSEDVQKIFDERSSEITEMAKKKESDILSV